MGESFSVGPAGLSSEVVHLTFGSTQPLDSLNVNPVESMGIGTCRPACHVTAPNLKKYTEAELAPLNDRRGWVTTTAPDGTRTTVQSSLGNHGNAALSTVLWPEGKVAFKPGGAGFVLENGALSMKFPWWRLVRGRLTIEGRRLDGPAPPLRARIPDGYGEIGFQATALIFPTPGCWEVTGRIADQSLTFVTLVQKIGNGPGR